MTIPLPLLREDLVLYGKLAQRQTGYVAGQIEVTSECFQRCRYCESWRDHQTGRIKGEWTLRQIQKFCTQLRKLPTFEHLTLTGGDPQAWKMLNSFLKDWSPSVKLQLSTALTQDLTPEEMLLWREKLHEVRVSLDAIIPETYETIRGVQNVTNPREVIRRMKELRHPRLSIIVTVYQENLKELPEILKLLDGFHHFETPIRKCHLLAAIGPRASKEQSGSFWDQWLEIQETMEGTLGIKTSFSEHPRLRRFLPDLEKLHCTASLLGFHAKANGDVYPCCLIGGEAVPTYEVVKLGNAHILDLPSLYRNAIAFAKKHPYADDALPCRDLCQWKQTELNMIGKVAEDTTLSMP